MEISAFVRNTATRHEAVVATGGNERTLALPPKASGFVADALRRHGVEGAVVAPPRAAS